MPKIERFPEVSDFIGVTYKNVEYFGYVYDVDYDFRHPKWLVEFWPGESSWFDLDQLTVYDFPIKKKI